MLQSWSPVSESLPDYQVWKQSNGCYKWPNSAKTDADHGKVKIWGPTKQVYQKPWECSSFKNVILKLQEF